MFAIEVNETTMAKIVSEKTITPVAMTSLEIYRDATSRYVFVSGWVSPKGGLPKDTILPMYVLKNYEYDTEKIKTDWDLIVRK